MTTNACEKVRIFMTFPQKVRLSQKTEKQLWRKGQKSLGTKQMKMIFQDLLFDIMEIRYHVQNCVKECFYIVKTT